MAWEGPGPPTDIDRSIRRWVGRCDTKFLHPILTDAAPAKVLLALKSWMPTGSGIQRDHETDVASSLVHTNSGFLPQGPA